MVPSWFQPILRCSMWSVEFWLTSVGAPVFGQRPLAQDRDFSAET